MRTPQQQISMTQHAGLQMTSQQPQSNSQLNSQVNGQSQVVRNPPPGVTVKGTTVTTHPYGTQQIRSANNSIPTSSVQSNPQASRTSSGNAQHPMVVNYSSQQGNASIPPNTLPQQTPQLSHSQPSSSNPSNAPQKIPGATTSTPMSTIPMQMGSTSRISTNPQNPNVNPVKQLASNRFVPPSGNDLSGNKDPKVVSSLGTNLPRISENKGLIKESPSIQQKEEVKLTALQIFLEKVDKLDQGSYLLFFLTL